MLRACHGAQSAPPGMAMKRLHLMSSIETFLDDTSAMELDGSFLTYSDMDFSSDVSDLREKQHQMALNTTFLSPIDHSGVYQKFESTQFLPFDPDVSVICHGASTDIDRSVSGSPLSISSWELDSQSDDIVAPPNSPDTTDANESTRRQLIVKAMQNYVATSRATDSVVTCVDPTCCSFVSCDCTDSSTNGREIVRKIADYGNDTCDDLDVAMLGERPPCDGMESPAETLQALKALPLATVRKHACSDGNVSSVMKHKKQNRSDVKTRQTSGKSIKDQRELLSKPVVKCSKLSLPGNVNSDDDMPRTSQYSTATGCCRKPNTNRDVCTLRVRPGPAKPPQLTLKPTVSSRTHGVSLSNNSRKKPPCHIANNMNPSDVLPGNGTTLSVSTLSCSINSDATCFMKRPLCRGGVTSRGQHVSQTRQAILSKKLKQIGRYLHRNSGVRRTHLIPELQTLGVV